MTVYYVDDGGSDTAPFDTWAKAATSLSALDDAVTFASGDIVYIGHDHVCQYTHSAHRVFTGPTSGAPCVIISATQGSSPPTYQKSSTDQIDTSEGSYRITFDGSFALYGVCILSGSTTSTAIIFASDSDEALYLKDCTFKLQAGASVGQISSTTSPFATIVRDLTVDLTNDGTTPNGSIVFSSSTNVSYHNLNFINAGYRTAVVSNGDRCFTSGADFSGFTNAAPCEIWQNGGNSGFSHYTNCKMAATWVGAPALDAGGAIAKFINCGSADQPVSLYVYSGLGDLVSSSSIYRSSGATVESTNTAWLITTSSMVSQDSSFFSEYIYGTISSTGSKTFDLYVVNDTADLNDDEIWLEVEYKADASSGKWALITDKPATRTTTPAAQTDDTTSTWNGTGPSFTYKQKLSVTATVNTTGLYRARVCVGKASISASDYLYIDPKVTVS